jgi:hypothetical protein
MKEVLSNAPSESRKAPKSISLYFKEFSGYEQPGKRAVSEDIPAL